MKVYLRNFELDGSLFNNLPVPFGKYKTVSKAYIEDNGKMQNLFEANIFFEVYEAWSYFL